MKRALDILVVLAVLVLGVLAFERFWPSFAEHPHLTTAGEEIFFGQNPVLSFSESIQQASVPEKIHVNPAVAYSLAWKDDKTLEIQFEDTPPEQIKIVFDEGITTREGVVITTPETVLLHIRESVPELVFQSPEADQTDIEGTYPITLLWEEPIFVLQSPKTAQEFLKKNIQILPAQKGSWQVLGTTGLLFEPEGAWAPATQYTIKINDSVVPEGLEWDFETLRPELLDLNAQELIQKRPLKLTWNQEIDLAALQEALTITCEEQALVFSVTYGEKEPSAFEPYPVPRSETSSETETEIDRMQTWILPQTTWPEHKTCSVEIPTKDIALQGILPPRNNIQKDFQTIAPFTVSETDLPITTIDGARVCFNTRVSSEVFAQHVSFALPEGTTLSEEQKKQWIGHPYESTCFWVGAPEGTWSPAIQYTFRVEPTMHDIYNRTLAQAEDIPFITKLPSRARALFWPRETRMFAQGTPIKLSVLYSGNITGLEVQTIDRLTGATQVKTFPLQGSETAEQIWEIAAKDLFPGKNRDEVLLPGAYEVAFRAVNPDEEKYRRDYFPNRFQFFVGDFGVEIENYADETFRLAPIPLQKEQPTLNTNSTAAVTIYNYDNKILSDQSVSLSSPISMGAENNLDFIRVQLDGMTGFGSREFTNGISPYDLEDIYFSDWDYRQKTSRVLLTDRPLYKPGDTVYWQGIFRERDWLTKAFPLKPLQETNNLQYKITINDSRWQEMATFTGSTQDGSLEGQWKIPEEGLLGQYFLTLLLSDGDFEKNAMSSQTPFYVGEYRKPKFLIDAHFSNDKALFNETQTLSVSAEYTFGGALAGKDVRYNINLFGHEKCHWFCYANNRDVSLLSGTTTLDNTGKLTLSVPLDIELDPDIIWELVTANITVIEAADEQSSASVSIPFHTANAQVTISPENYLIEGGEEITFSGTIEDLEENALTKHKVTLQLLEQTWVRNDQKDTDGDYLGEWRREETLLKTVNVKSDEQGKFEGMFVAPETSGEYLIRATVRDKQNRETSAEYDFWIWDRNSDTPNIRINDTNKLLPLFGSQESYNVGETASVLLPEELKVNTRLTAKIVRGTVLEDITPSEVSNQISFIVEPWMAPNVYLMVQTESFDEDGMPVLRWGALNIPVDAPEHEAKLTITPEKQTFTPGEQATLRIKTSVEDKPVSGFVTVAVVDESLLALKARQELNLWQSFLQHIPLGVRISHPYANFLSEKELDDIYANVEKIKADLATGFGGGGGMSDEALKGGNFKPRGDFRDTAIFKAQIQTDANGEALLSFDLPDNVTTWNVWGLVHTQENAFGETETSFRATLPLLLSEIVPQVFRFGDETTVGVLVRNNSLEQTPKKVTVTLHAPDLFQTDETTQTFTVKDQARVFFPVSLVSSAEARITEPQEVTLRFDVQTEGSQDSYQDAIEITREILPPYQEIAAAEFLRVEDNQNLRLQAKTIPSRHSEVIMTLFSSLGERFQDFLTPLQDKNFGCTEQDLSQQTAEIFLKKTNVESLTKARDAIEMNFVGNGYGFWGYGYEAPSEWVTTQVLEFAPQWSNAGAPFATEHLEPARDWLRDRVLLRCDKNSFDCLSPTLRLHASYILTRDKTLPFGDWVQIADEVKNPSPEAQLWWLRTAHIQQERGNALPSNLQTKEANYWAMLDQSLKASDQYIYWEDSTSDYWSQNERLTALALITSIENNRQEALWAKILRYLADSQPKTLSSNTLLRLIQAQNIYAETVGENRLAAHVHITAQQNDATETWFESTLTEEKTFTQPLETNDPVDIELTAENQHPFFADIRLTEDIEAASIADTQKGFWIEREIFAFADDTYQTPLTELTAGEAYRVRLKIITNRDHRQVVLRDPIPSGTEGVNFDLDNTAQEYRIKEESPRCFFWCDPFISHQEVRDEEMRFFFDSIGKGTHIIEYVLNARIAGEYELLPSHIAEMYHPEVFANGKGARISIKTAR